MTIPKRFSEVLEENTPSFRMPKIVSRLGPIRFKTGGLAPGIIVEALVNDERVAHLVATKEANGNYIIDDVHVEPEYRNNGVATALLRTAHETVSMIPYALTDDQVYRSEAGRRLAIKELRIHTAGPLLAIPEIVAIAGEAAAGTAVADAAGTAVAETAAGTAAADAAGTAAADAAAGGGGIAATGESAAGSSGGAGGLVNRSKGLWNKIPKTVQKGIQFGTGKSIADQVLKPNQNAGSGGSMTVTPTMGPYGGGGGGGGAYQVGRMLGSKQANPTMADVPKLLELILETLCGCGQPTAGKFNGMPHCIPGTGCSGGVGQDGCCSCGDENAAGTFHGEAVCAPGQGCNNHWQPGVGRKWNPSMETPSEKIADHDNWAQSTNHGERETTWEI